MMCETMPKGELTVKVPDLVLGSEWDNDQVIRQMGFDEGAILAEFVSEKTGVKYKIFSLGDQRVWLN
jgi:hypothetical protein